MQELAPDGRLHSLFASPVGSADYRELPPGPALRPWLDCLWTVRAAGRPLEHTVLPDGCADLVWDRSGGVRVIGSARSYSLARLAAGEVVVGARLRPGALTALLGVPADEVTDDAVALADVTSDRRIAADTPEAALKGLAAFLEHRCRDAAAPDALVAATVARLQRTDRRAGVGEIARDLHISERQLRRRVRAAAGYGPRRLARVLRMQALLTAATAAPVPRGHWPRMAVGFGYADESHMVNDVTELAGESPHRLARRLAGVSD